MNRQEIIEQLKLIQAGLTQDDNNKSKNRIDAVIENLKQPITLADFLGWEENAIYTNGEYYYYKIQNGNLFCKKIGKCNNLWELSGYNEYFNYCYNFRQYDKVEKTEPKYNLILQKGYRKLFDLLDCEKYLTMDIDEKTIFNSKYATDNSKYQAQFTLKEIENIKKKFKIDLSIYDVVEVQE